MMYWPDSRAERKMNSRSPTLFACLGALVALAILLNFPPVR